MGDGIHARDVEHADADEDVMPGVARHDDGPEKDEERALAEVHRHKAEPQVNELDVTQLGRDLDEPEEDEPQPEDEALEVAERDRQEAVNDQQSAKDDSQDIEGLPAREEPTWEFAHRVRVDSCDRFTLSLIHI